MSYVSVLKNIPEFLTQPAGIAVIASVGIHGAIAFILPLMPVDSKPKQKASTQSVGLVELSKEEQNRLPKNQSPQISALPKVPLQSALPLPKFATKPTPLDKLNPGIDSTKVILPPLPQSSANPKISSLPRNKSLPVLRQPNFNSSFNAKARSSGGSFRRLNPKIELRPSASLPSTKRNRVSRRALPNITPIQPAPFPSELTKIPTPPPLPPTGNPGMSGSNGVPMNPQITPNYNNGVAVNQPRVISPQDFVARADINVPKPADELTFAGQSLQKLGQRPSGQKIDLPQQPSVSQSVKLAPKNTRTLTLAKQFEEVRGRYPNSEVKTPISDVIKTKPGKEGKVEGTLVVDSDGKVDYFKLVDRSVSSDLKKATRNYFRNYIKKNRDSIRRNGKPKVYAFNLDFRSDRVNSIEFSKPTNELVDRLRSSKNTQTRVNNKPSEKESGNTSRSAAPVKINAQPSSSPVVVPSATSEPIKLKPQLQVPSSNNNKPAVQLEPRRNQEVPKVPSLPKPEAEPKPEAQINIKQPTTQATSKPSVVVKLKNGRENSVSENNSNKPSSSKDKLLQKLRQVKKQRENSK